MRGKRGEDCENGFDGTREHPGKGEQAISKCPPESGEAGREEERRSSSLSPQTRFTRSGRHKPLNYSIILIEINQNLKYMTAFPRMWHPR